MSELRTDFYNLSYAINITRVCLPNYTGEARCQRCVRARASARRLGGGGGEIYIRDSAVHLSDGETISNLYVQTASSSAYVFTGVALNDAQDLRQLCVNPTTRLHCFYTFVGPF